MEPEPTYSILCGNINKDIMHDVVLVNLRVISKLQPGDRLQCNDSKYFGIDRGWFTFIYRWLKADTRHITLERLDETIVAARQRIHEPCMKKLLQDACTGFRHLIDTYHNDPTTVARIETLLTKCSVPVAEPVQNAVDLEQAL